MKILNILDHSLPLHSGYTFRSRNLFKAQKAMGFSPLVLTSPKHEESAGDTLSSLERINNIDYHRTGRVAYSSIPMASEWKLMRRLYKRVMEVAVSEGVDIIHAHSPILNGIPAILAGRKLGKPVVYEIRAFWEDAAVDHGTYRENSWKYRLTKRLETGVCKYADHVCILCNGLKNDLVSRGIPGAKITPVFNGVNPEEFKPAEPDRQFMDSWGLKGKKVVGFVGSFYRYEGLDLLVRAFGRLAESRPEWRLLLVGGGEMEDELTSLAAELGIEDRVVMPGRIPHERIAGVYAMIDILAYPRYSMRLTELVTPLKPLEAMAMGKALIASDVGGHRELISHEKTGFLFPAGDLDRFSRTLGELMQAGDTRAALGRQGMEWVRQNHTWAVTTSVYKGIYRCLSGKYKGSAADAV
ncbi:MAG: glycosyltransferase, exosortase A system-associated [Desulfobacterales bacterium]|nr:glycosyltransferase, exosortase A system-associated [Desulfobacterales bacterium]